MPRPRRAAPVEDLDAFVKVVGLDEPELPGFAMSDNPEDLPGDAHPPMVAGPGQVSSPWRA